MTNPVPVCVRCWRPVEDSSSAAPPYSLRIDSGGDVPLALLLCARCSALFPDAAARDAFLARAASLAPFETTLPTAAGVRVVVWDPPRRWRCAAT